MKVLLQTRTGQFLDNREHWTSNPRTAHAFANGLDALRYSLDHQLQDIEIFYEFENPRLSFAVPISDIQSSAFFQSTALNASA